MVKKIVVASALATLLPLQAFAQDVLPADNGVFSYHTAPRYRESESSPLRLFAYVLHPIGWVAREVIFRPLSYFASSTETTRSVMGYREPYDYRQPECFSADDSAPDCRSLSPFNYENAEAATGDVASANAPAPVGSGTDEAASINASGERQVYFPDVNFDFNVRKLNDLGQGRAHQISELLKKQPGLKVVLQGNADYVGDDKFNEKLGMDRAEALRGELLKLGVPAERLSTVSFGESQPLLGDQETWARAVNRRVEVHVGEGAAAAQ